jgi:hypothetical protein
LRAKLKRLHGELYSNNTEFVRSLSFLDETDNALKQGPYAATATTAFQSTLHKCYRLKATRTMTLELVAKHKSRDIREGSCKRTCEVLSLAVVKS